MKNLEFTKRDEQTYIAYFMATDGFRLHIEYEDGASSYTAVGIRSTSKGSYSECWNTRKNIIDERFTLEDESETLYIRVRSTMMPKLAQVDNDTEESEESEEVISLRKLMGDMNDLKTGDKTSIVAALNSFAAPEDFSKDFSSDFGGSVLMKVATNAKERADIANAKATEALAKVADIEEKIKDVQVVPFGTFGEGEIMSFYGAEGKLVNSCPDEACLTIIEVEAQGNDFFTFIGYKPKGENKVYPLVNWDNCIYYSDIVGYEHNKYVFGVFVDDYRLSDILDRVVEARGVFGERVVMNSPIRVCDNEREGRLFDKYVIPTISVKLTDEEYDNVRGVVVFPHKTNVTSLVANAQEEADKSFDALRRTELYIMKQDPNFQPSTLLELTTIDELQINTNGWFYISTDGVNYKEIYYCNLRIPANTTVYLYGETPSLIGKDLGKEEEQVFSILHFGEGKFKMRGNLMCLLSKNGTRPLTKGCFFELFKDSGIVEAPMLPAMELSEFCYASMFENCVNLTKAPYLPATQLADGCYDRMFYGCSNLSSVHIGATDWYDYKNETDSISEDWLEGVASEGTFYNDNDCNHYDNMNIPTDWEEVIPEFNINNF